MAYGWSELLREDMVRSGYDTSGYYIPEIDQWTIQFENQKETRKEWDD